MLSTASIPGMPFFYSVNVAFGSIDIFNLSCLQSQTVKHVLHRCLQPSIVHSQYKDELVSGRSNSIKSHATVLAEKARHIRRKVLKANKTEQKQLKKQVLNK